MYPQSWKAIRVISHGITSQEVTSYSWSRASGLGHDLDRSDLAGRFLDGSGVGPHAFLAVLEQLHLVPRVPACISVAIHFPEERPAVACRFGGLTEAGAQSLLLIH